MRHKRIAQNEPVNRRWKLVAAAAIALFVIGGVVALYNTQAATLFLALESEQGTVTAPARITPDSTASGGSSVRFGGSVNGRENLIYGNYEPDANTTGVIPGTQLTAYTGPTTITADGTVIENKEVFSDLKIQAKNVTIRNSKLRGSKTVTTSQTAIIDANHPKVENLRIIDCEIVADRPQPGRDGIIGHHFYAYRNRIHGTNDGIGIYNNPSVGDSAGVAAYGNWIYDLVYWKPDPLVASHPDGTHNDGIQVQGGFNIDILGNRLQATSHLGDDRPFGGVLSDDNSDKPGIFTQSNGPHANGSAIIIQANGGRKLDASVKARKNYISNGLTGANLNPGIYEFSGNRFYRSAYYMFNQRVTAQYPIRPTSQATAAMVIGLDTNAYMDNGEVLTEANRGITY